MCSILLGANPKAPLIYRWKSPYAPCTGYAQYLGYLCEASLNCQLSLNLASEEATCPVIAKLSLLAEEIHSPVLDMEYLGVFCKILYVCDLSTTLPRQYRSVSPICTVLGLHGPVELI